MKQTLCIALTFLLLIGYLHVADTPFAAQLKAQESATQTDGEKADEATEEKKPERAPVRLEKITIVLEGEEVQTQEGIHEWSTKAAQLCLEYYPILDKIFMTEGFVPQKELTLIFRKMDGVAFSSGTTITISADWIRRSPGDFGMVAHEMVHNIQRYGGGRGQGGIPTWAMEGITDFARHAYYEPDVLMRPVNLETNKYSDSYQITGGFFMWIEHAYDKEFVKKLNQHARTRTWSEDVFEKYTGKGPEELWKEYVEFLKTIEGTRILPTRDFGREKLGSTYSVQRSQPPQQQRQGQGQGQGRQRPQQEGT